MKLPFKSSIIVLIVLLLSVAFFFNQQILLTLDGSRDNDTEHSEHKNHDSHSSKDIERTPSNKKSSRGNSAAEGLSKFYEKIYGSGKRDGVEIINNIIYLPDPKGDIEELLKARSLVVRPYPKSWVGTKKSRAFRKGETIYEKLSEYLQEEKLEIIWWTNRDFIIKDNFRINKNITYTVYQLSNAISGHFENGLSAFLCYKERSIVITDEPFKYLFEHCRLIQSQKVL
tara:strand:- start:52 stop:735 length:684 start_codon:yes stop_codon:yes gene_type:complete